MKHTFRLITTGLMIFVLILYLGGCSKQAPVQPGNAETVDWASALSKSNLPSTSKSNKGAYPQFASRTLHYENDQSGYEGGNMNASNGSTFHLEAGALTPPPGTPLGAEVTLTMLVEKDASLNQLLFSFGPSGCQFNPPAEVWFDWSNLGSTKAKLYYIDANGNYVEQQPESIDFQGQRMSLHISHFSRYALAQSR